VNKLDNIENEFRVFKMELLAGEPNYIVQHHESGCNFTFDFSDVYYNSRLYHEHSRLVSVFKPEDVIADVFAGVGPFAVPAAKKGCAVLANDLNPTSFKYLQVNAETNKAADRLRPFCQDGREFIRAVFRTLFDNPFPAFTPPKSATQLARERRQKTNPSSTESSPPGPDRKRINHFVMNLPGSAIEFLDALRGVLSQSDDLRLVYGQDQLPTIHCYCFTKEMEADKAEQDIRQRVSERLGVILGEASFHFVRAVAPKKDMYCVSFQLPAEVAYSHL